ncbi:MAG: UDP-N-acetylglucosamine pyrophosphorylase [Ruminococcaceae bacterium]|nr:UDP-N-acetylglucosamine pyrophosphorylase [Oscillospiraceae bacterium]
MRLNKLVKIKELFDCRVGYLTEFFEKYEYPWEMLGHINEYIVQLMAEGVNGFTEISPGVLAGENVKIYAGAVIEAPAVIGSGTHIRPGAFIRGNVITGENCVIGNSSELKNCILLDKVQLPHYNYVGDSVMGNGAHLGAGAVCSNLKADGDNVVIHGESEYLTGIRKVGGFVGDGGDVGCGCVLNPGTVIGKNTSVYPLTSLRGVYPADCIVKSQNEIVKRKV